jgi:hypothetical protein
VGELAFTHLGSVVAGYVIAGVSLAGYIGSLLVRARRARLRAAAIAAKRAR